jgi:hypothetical protein
MVNLKRLTDRAKDVVEKRGGTDALKADAEELRGIAKGKGSLKDKAKAAAAAMKEPGRKGGERGRDAGGGPAPGHREAGPSGAPKQEGSPERSGPTRSK